MDNRDITSLQRIRRQRTMYAIGGGAMLSAVIIMLYWRGSMRLDALSLCIGMFAFWSINLSFIAMIASGANLRLREPSMTFAMMLWSAVSSFAWIYFADGSRHLLLMVYLLSMMLGAFRLRLNQYLQITTLSLLLYATVIAALAHNHPQNVSLATEGMNWLVFMLVMLGFSLLGNETSKVRTELQHRNRQLQDARDSAAIANQAKSRFLASASHELRTPLNAILGATEIITPHALPAQEKNALQRARSAGLYLLSLINSMIDMSQLESGKLRIRPGRSDLFAELLLVREITQPHAESLGLQVRIDTNISNPFDVEMDNTRLREVLVHLIRNAIHATHKSEIVVSAKRIRQKDDLVTIEFRVTDSATAMTPADIEKQNKTTQYQQGITPADETSPVVWMSICQELIQLMGGTLDTQNTSGITNNICFTLTLPRVHKNAEQKTTHGADTPLPTCRILIVDDAKDNRMLLELFLRNETADIDTADDGMQALALFKSQHYDIVLMDVHMPRMNGIEATKAIRLFEKEQGRTGAQRAKILAVTADDSDNDQQRSLQAGCDAHLVKPVARATLLDNLHRLHSGLRPRQHTHTRE